MCQMSRLVSSWATGNIIWWRCSGCLQSCCKARLDSFNENLRLRSSLFEDLDAFVCCQYSGNNSIMPDKLLFVSLSRFLECNVTYILPVISKVLD